MAKSVLPVRSDRRIAGSADKETTFRKVWYTTAGVGRLWPEKDYIFRLNVLEGKGAMVRNCKRDWIPPAGGYFTYSHIGYRQEYLDYIECHSIMLLCTMLLHLSKYLL